MAAVPLVFVDVDETLIGCKSLFDFLDFYFTGRYGAAGAQRVRSLAEQLRAQASAGVPREISNRAYYRVWRGESAAEVADWGRRWFAKRSAADGFFLPETRQALFHHRAAGAVIVLVSGSFGAVLDPIAEAVGAAHVLCTRPRIRNGLLDGSIIGDPVVGEGKRRVVRRMLARLPHIDPADCFAYGDHVSDLPMLAEVGHPVIVGDCGDLVRHLPAAERLPVSP